jgi:hypothetical protein
MITPKQNSTTSWVIHFNTTIPKKRKIADIKVEIAGNSNLSFFSVFLHLSMINPPSGAPIRASIMMAPARVPAVLGLYPQMVSKYFGSQTIMAVVTKTMAAIPK